MDRDDYLDKEVPEDEHDEPILPDEDEWYTPAQVNPHIYPEEPW